MEDAPIPTVSIILPTYNRARFLPRAIESICSQEFADWELIVVDDGSTDDTPELLSRLTTNIAQPVRIVRQDNQGAYAARNTGLGYVMGRYIAFFDSDDLWLANHLKDCAAALDVNPDVDWVYGACRIVDFSKRETIAESHFQRPSGAVPFLSLNVERRGELRVIIDPGILQCAIKFSLECGLQHSVIRTQVLANRQFHTDFRNEAEDQLAVIRAAAEGCRFGYVTNVHVEYNIHGENSSAVGDSMEVDKKAAVLEALVRGFERLPGDIPLSASHVKALRWRLGREMFWHIGYAILWSSGRRSDALSAFKAGIRYWPWDLRYWKTYLVCRAKVALNIVSAR